MGFRLYGHTKSILEFSDYLIEYFTKKLGFTKVVEEANEFTIRLAFEAKDQEDSLCALKYNNLTYLGRYEIVIDIFGSTINFKYYLAGCFVSQNLKDISNSFYSSIPYRRRFKFGGKVRLSPFFSSYQESLDYNNLIEKFSKNNYPINLDDRFVDSNYATNGSYKNYEYLISCFYKIYDTEQYNNLNEIVDELTDKALPFLCSQECKEYMFQLYSFMFERVQLA